VSRVGQSGRSGRRGRREPRGLGELVDAVLGDLGLGGVAEIAALDSQWERIVGAEVAAHARPTALRNGVLEAEVDSSVWCQQLLMRREELLGALRRELGESAPRELWLRVGSPGDRRSRLPR